MALIAILLAGIENEADRKRFEQFFSEYKDYALHIALSILHDHSFAEDAVQEAFTYLIHHPQKVFDYEEGSAKWYLSALVKDFAHNIMRKESRNRHISLEEVSEMVSEDMFLEAVNRAKIEDVRQAILSLDEMDQSIVRLFYYKKYKTKEIAQMFHLSDAGVRKRLQRARSVLKNALEEIREEVYE